MATGGRSSSARRRDSLRGVGRGRMDTAERSLRSGALRARPAGWSNRWIQAVTRQRNADGAMDLLQARSTGRAVCGRWVAASEPISEGAADAFALAHQLAGCRFAHVAMQTAGL